MTPITLRRHAITLVPRIDRVIIRPFIPSGTGRIAAILDRAFALSEDEVTGNLDAVLKEFDFRHFDIESVLLSNYAKIVPHLINRPPLSRPRKLFIGVLFSGEYSVESAALFNPSIVPDPDQTGVPAGGLRFIMSLRATGEGHISSIEFRSGLIDSAGDIRLDPVSRFLALPEVVPKPRYKKQQSVYEIDFSPNSAISERVIFPVSANESNGIEDARFVRFIEDDGSVLYYATYTAYNGHAILPQLIETNDFLHFHVLTLKGGAVKNKGMALFPRRIDGRYTMLSRQDDENLFIMFSDDPHSWSDAKVLLRPAALWESVKIGNCGSPIETEAGWLVITHGVGPMRKYCIGAALLDLNDPRKVIGRLRDPLLATEGTEREGYVPNVVYSCGSLRHGRDLILPYAMNDRVTTIASVSIDDLIAVLKQECTRGRIIEARA
jgi:predicted GH43/DUF377 family glycosyl hydrolase